MARTGEAVFRRVDQWQAARSLDDLAATTSDDAPRKRSHHHDDAVAEATIAIAAITSATARRRATAPDHWTQASARAAAALQRSRAASDAELADQAVRLERLIKIVSRGQRFGDPQAAHAARCGTPHQRAVRGRTRCRRMAGCDGGAVAGCGA